MSKKNELKRDNKGRFIRGQKPLAGFKTGFSFWKGKKLSEEHKKNISDGEN